MPKGSHGLIFECKGSKSFAFMQIIKQKKVFCRVKFGFMRKNSYLCRRFFRIRAKGAYLTVNERIRRKEKVIKSRMHRTRVNDA